MESWRLCLGCSFELLSFWKLNRSGSREPMTILRINWIKFTFRSTLVNPLVQCVRTIPSYTDTEYPILIRLWIMMEYFTYFLCRNYSYCRKRGDLLNLSEYETFFFKWVFQVNRHREFFTAYNSNIIYNIIYR